MTTYKKVVILTVPFCIPNPMLAPALLSGCLNSAGVSSIGLDFNFSLYEKFSEAPWWAKFRTALTMRHLVTEELPMSVNVSIMRHLVRYLRTIRVNHDPEWIGLSLFTHESVDFSYVMIRMIRKLLPNAKIVLGGRALELVHGPTGMLHSKMYLDRKLADLIIVGDAETSLPIAIMADKRGIVISQPQTQIDLDSLPLPNWEGYDLKSYTQNGVADPFMSITASKGCVRHCTFCDVASFWPKYIFRSGVSVANEMVHNYQMTGIRSFRFTDNLINGSISNYRAMNERLLTVYPARTLTHRGYAIFRGAESMPASDFKLASDAGCVDWFIGVESGSERIRNEMKKKFSNDDIDYAANQLYKNNIRQHWLFMVGFPSETEADFQETLTLLNKHSKWAASGAITISVTSPFMVLDNSPLRTDPDLSAHYDFKTELHTQHFWVSKSNLDNTFPVRADRWKRFVRTVEENGYSWSPNMDSVKELSKVLEYERLYNDNYKKVIRISKV